MLQVWHLSLGIEWLGIFFSEGVNVKPGTKVTNCFAEPDTNQVVLTLDSGEQVCTNFL